MENDAYGAMPRRRTKALVVRAHGDETLVLDRRRLETVHCLPAEVARVWDACTGKNTLAEIASVAGIDEPTAARTVDQLLERDLLDVPAGADRRKFLQRTALVGAGALAATGIQSIVSSPAWAATSVFVSVTMTSGICSIPMNRLGSFTFMVSGGRPNTQFTVEWAVINNTTLQPVVLLPSSTTTFMTDGNGNGSTTSGMSATGTAPSGDTYTLTFTVRQTSTGRVAFTRTQTVAYPLSGSACVFPTTSLAAPAPAPGTSSPGTTTSTPAPATSTPAGTTTSSAAPATPPAGTPAPTSSP